MHGRRFIPALNLIGVSAASLRRRRTGRAQLSTRVMQSLIQTGVLIAVCLTGIAHAATSRMSPAPPSACDLADAPRANFLMQIPFEVIDGRIYVQARVNTRGPFRFAIDTGASGLGRADTSLVSTLGLHIQNSTTNSDGLKTAKADTTQLASLDVGGLFRRNLRVITRDYNSRMSPAAAFSGIIAREFFSDGLLIIDYRRKTLSYSERLGISPQHTAAVDYERPFRVPVSIGALQIEGNLDTGANVTFVVPGPLLKKIEATPVEHAGSGQLSNSEMETMRATVRGPIRIGDVTLSDVEVRVSDDYPELLVGAHALQNFTVLIDQRSKRVALCR